MKRKILTIAIGSVLGAGCFFFYGGLNIAVAATSTTYTTNDAEIQALKSTHDIRFAYFQKNTPWYLVGVKNLPGNVFFLASVDDTNPGWGLIGGRGCPAPQATCTTPTLPSVGTVDISKNVVSINSGVANNSPTDGFFNAASSKFLADMQARPFASNIDGTSDNTIT
jgi:hypothetical protein